jgi:glyoxylase-like metal-dependent hydrolase (beta-lactamase superfamily II)
MPSDDALTVRAAAPGAGVSSSAAGRGAWAEPGVYPVAPGVHRIPLPLPGDSLRAVNVYAIEDDNRIVLVDSGWHRPDSWDALRGGLRAIGSEIGDISRVLVTHIHHDHFGQAPRIRQESGATILLGEGERVSFETVLDAGERGRSRAQAVAMLRSHGASALAVEWSAVLAQGDAPAPGFAMWEPPDVYATDAATVELGSRSLRVVETRGHTRGHVSLLDEAHGVLFTGDHVLPHITPSIGVEPLNDGGALVEYIMSLSKVWGLPVTRVLPAHGPEFDDLSGRVDALLDHHATRLTACTDAVRTAERSAATVATMLPWTRRERRFDELDLFNRYLAVNESIAHLELLRTQGTISRREVGGTYLYRVTPDD